jgi:DNA ligase-1
MKRRIFYTLMYLLAVMPISIAVSAEKPRLLLAETYPRVIDSSDDIDVNQYWVSEKLDGVRAYWNGKQLISRQGNVFNAPKWFVQDFPRNEMDGELWIKRNFFERVISTVKKQKPIDSEWKQIGFYVFELPNEKGDFTQRIQKMQQRVNASKSPYLFTVPQFRVGSTVELYQLLDDVTDDGAEGLMLHHQDAHYKTGRSHELLKLKRYEDAEAIVIAHMPGKGRNTGRMGALLVEMSNKKRFKIGTGFTDRQRNKPPKVGAIITYKYYGLSVNGIPKFASFLRERNTPH